MGYTNASGATVPKTSQLWLLMRLNKVPPPLPVNFMPGKINIPQPLRETRFAKFHQGLETKAVMFNG